MPTLHWLTRDEDLRTASRVPYRLMERMPRRSGRLASCGNTKAQARDYSLLPRKASTAGIYTSS